jgi:hypothetical protein
VIERLSIARIDLDHLTLEFSGSGTDMLSIQMLHLPSYFFLDTDDFSSKRQPLPIGKISGLFLKSAFASYDKWNSCKLTGSHLAVHSSALCDFTLDCDHKIRNFCAPCLYCLIFA